jgi:hypothetical protein
VFRNKPNSLFFVLSPDTETLKLAVRKAYADSLWHTTTKLLGFKDLTTHTHLPIIRALESRTRRKLICVPRGTFKSSIASVAFPIWLLIRNPNLRVLIDSEVYSNSKNYLRQIKNLMLSDTFVQIFGDYRTDVWNESEIIIAPRTKILKDPSIVVGGIETTKVGLHVDVIIGDDYNSPANSETPDQRKKVIDHYQMNQSILETDGLYVIIGTRYSEGDLIGWVLENELGLKGEKDLSLYDKPKGVYEF